MKKGPFGKLRCQRGRRLRALLRGRTRTRRKRSPSSRSSSRSADELYLATDEDREGEAIAWHLLQVLKPKVPVRRMVFHRNHEGSRSQRALENTRDLDTAPGGRAGDPPHPRPPRTATRSRPVLWRKVRAGLSAGRVQSVATRLVVERERERMAFVRRQVLGRSRRLLHRRRCQAFGARAARRGRPLTSRPARDSSRRATRERDRPASTSRQVPHLRSRPTARRTTRQALADRRRPRSSTAVTDDKPYKPPPGRPLHHLHPPAGGVAQAAHGIRVRDHARRAVASTRPVTSPTCVPTPRRCPARRSTPPARRPPSSTGPRPCPTSPRLYATTSQGRAGGPRGDPPRR